MSDNGASAGRRAVVVGAGIVGVSCALNLLDRGFDVTLVDEREPGEGTSFGNAGIAARCAIVPVPAPGLLRKLPKMLSDPMGPLSVDPLHVLRNLGWFVRFLRSGRRAEMERIAGELFKLTDGSIDEHLALAKGTGGESWIEPSEYLYVYRDRAAFEQEAEGWALRARHGIEWREVGRNELREMEPDLSEEFGFAVALPQHGFVLDPSKLVKGLAETFAARGGHLLRARVHAIETGPQGAVALASDAGRLPFDTLVIAAGVWSAELIAPLGLRVPLLSERGYHIQIADPGIRHVHPMMVASGKYVATPMAGGTRLAGMVEFRPLDAPPHPELPGRLKAHARALFPGIAMDSVETWLGHRPSLPDSLPVIGALPGHPNVLLAFGHQHIGLTTGPRTGRWIAQLATGERPNVDLSPFSADRFA